ncbi:MAG TPA: ATP-binding cassette domain-containing protein, partial [Thermodesulfovibrionales bacterium]|nr:ATP-binding cassette domain-containing protein [Thermodesulfovibrionales bacterium]
MSLLAARDLTISFRGPAHPFNVVTNLSFSIDKAEVFGLVGESGCGKSLTALSIMRILPQNAYAVG